MSLEELSKLIRDKPIVYKENPHWSFDEKISHKDGRPFSLADYEEILSFVKSYFVQVWKSFETEAQVLVVTASDYQTLQAKNITLPTIYQDDLVVLVLPQVNTWGNTSISEKYWQTVIVDNDINPVMRIHSHHILDAYQSTTDWSTLNSGTLEVVIGKILDEESIYAYWLDERGKETKDFVWQCKTLTSEPQSIPNGKA